MKDHWVNKCGYDNSAISLMRTVHHIKNLKKKKNSAPHKEDILYMFLIMFHLV